MTHWSGGFHVSDRTLQNYSDYERSKGRSGQPRAPVSVRPDPMVVLSGSTIVLHWTPSRRYMRLQKKVREILRPASGYEDLTKV